MSTECFRNWSLTINNPTADDDAIVKSATDSYKWIKEIIGQKEVGENGTEHYQLYVRTDKVRFNRVKSVFPRAHIEPGRNVAALKKYVQKKETAVANTQLVRKQALPTDIYAEALHAYVPSPCYYKSFYSYPKTFDTIDDIMDAYDAWNEYDDDYDVPRTFATRLLLSASNILVKKGLFVEHIASNPAFKQAFKDHMTSILERSAKNEDTPSSPKAPNDQETDSPDSW